MAIRLTGWAAIEFAEKNGCRLSKKTDPRGPLRDDLDVDEARRIAQLSPDSIYVDFDELPPSNVA
jgi:hypothetical protein